MGCHLQKMRINRYLYKEKQKCWADSQDCWFASHPFCFKTIFKKPMFKYMFDALNLWEYCLCYSLLLFLLELKFSFWRLLAPAWVLARRRDPKPCLGIAWRAGREPLADGWGFAWSLKWTIETWNTGFIYIYCTICHGCIGCHGCHGKTEDTGGHTAVARLMMRTTPRRPTKRKTRQGSTSQDGGGWLT